MRSMTSKPSNNGRVVRAICGGAVAIAAATLCGIVSPHSVATAAAASGPNSAKIVVVDDSDNGNSVNDQGQNSGDIFTQNAQDQSTA